ncbi:peptide-binding protein [Ammoniphilus sp. CFH 90114]|uniref:peptide-binding protein n=1 Tax=Ammoniphilus sp. CFH 90114 TaxID=2493665 RepID=UPI00100DE199|nr:peptide-binding protein [Ammoniphilus sp. CFH 90114]RXT13494.1 hypothetical protein EIZ39_04895 [Ammoniphilus sp. CFH 90114]
MRKTRPLFSLFTLFLSLLLVSTQGTSVTTGSMTREQQEKQHLIVGTIGSPTIFNPYFSADGSSGQVEALLYNGLVRYDPNLNPVPDLSERWEVSADGYHWTFHLKKGVKFHDGVEVTSRDVVFSYNIPRSEGYTGPRASDFEKIKDIQALDPYTVHFTLKEPYAPFLSTCVYAVLPSHLLEKVAVEKLAELPFNTKEPVGTGPYRFVTWKDGQYVQLEGNEEYFDGAPKITSLYFRIIPDQNAQLIQLQSGGIDVMGIPPTDLAVGRLFENQGKVKLHTTPSLAYTYIGYNQKHPFFQDVRVRQALTYALNRQQLVDIVLEGQGQVAHTHGTPLSWAFENEVPRFSYDPEKAKQLLAEAGWKDHDGDGILDKDGEKFSFVLLTNQGNKLREMVSQIVQEQWARIGIEVKPRMMEWSAFINDYVETKKFDAVILAWSIGVDPDPTSIWHSKEIDKGLNFISYRNEIVDQLLEENTRQVDKGKRKEVLQEFQKIIAEEQPYTFLYYSNGITAFPTNLDGIVNHPAGGLYNIQQWRYR